MTEDQLKQELAKHQEFIWVVATAYGANFPSGKSTFDAHFSAIEKAATRFSDQRAADAYDEGYHNGVDDEIECVEASGEHLDLQKKLGSGAVTPPEQSADGNASGAAHNPSCPTRLPRLPETVEDAENLLRLIAGKEASTNNNAPQSPTSTDAKKGDTNDK